jgi:hypothetical protein
MLAVYATHAAPDDPLSALKIGERPEPEVREGWVRVQVSHASLNRHDLFTLRGMSGHPAGITYPLILGNDAAGTLEDGTTVVIYPVMGSDEWCGDETLDPGLKNCISARCIFRSPRPLATYTAFFVNGSMSVWYMQVAISRANRIKPAYPVGVPKAPPPTLPAHPLSGPPV